ncbi:MAG TPA: hypothetical protein VG890_04450 [Puia sp.]|nr:hypothetical protein [Puia sp.]
MKKLTLFFFSCLAIASLPAQKCLDINIASLMSQMQAPEGAGDSYKKCNTTKNEHQQTVIANYGSDIVQLDTMLNRKMAEFSAASVAGSSVHAPSMSSQDISDAKELAATLQSMTPEQQRAWAEQVAQEKMKSAGTSKGGYSPENAEASRAVFQTQDIAINQMRVLNDELRQKTLEINDAAEKEINALSRDDKTKCPSDVVGMPSCDCANQIEGKYWKQVLAIRDKYDNQKIALFKAYFPKMQAMATTVDNTVTKYRHGDALQSPQLKNMLFSSQSSAFGNAFLMLAKCLEDIRKDGSDAFVNKLNSDNKVFDVSCSAK